MKTLSLSEIRHNLASGLVERFEREYGKNLTDEILRNFASEKSPVLRVNTLKTDVLKIMNMFRELNIRFERVAFLPNSLIIMNKNEKFFEDLDIYKNGEIYFQGISSQLPPIFLEAQPGEKILDLCAAPGSKTTQIGALMQNQGEIVAMERDQIRAERLKYNLAKQGVSIAEVMNVDAAIPLPELDEQFDRILLDAPCSAEGRINLSEGRSFKFWSGKNIRQNAKLQRRLFRVAVRYLKPGGTLVYSTCTLAPEENEMMVQWALEEFAELKLVPIKLDFKYKLPVSVAGTLKAMPSKISEGFFVAKFGKD